MSLGITRSSKSCKVTSERRGRIGDCHELIRAEGALAGDAKGDVAVARASSPVAAGVVERGARGRAISAHHAKDERRV